MPYDLENRLDASASIAQVIDANVNGSAIDLQQVQGVVKVVLTSAAGTEANWELDVFLQDSADGSNFANITGAAFDTVGNAASTQSIGLDTRSIRRYVRASAIIDGNNSPEFSAHVVVVASPKYRP